MIYVALIGIVICLGWLGYLTMSLRKFTAEKKSILEHIEENGLESIVDVQNKNINKIEVDTKELYSILEEQDVRLKQSITKYGVIRFNPFAGEGGNQSFSVALLNDHNDGVVISSLYSRSGGSRIFAKELKAGVSEISLTKEEEQAIKNAG